MSLKNRPGWPKVSKLKRPEGIEEGVTDTGIVERREKQLPPAQQFEYLKAWVSQKQPPFIERLKEAESALREWLASGEFYPDQEPKIKRLIAELKFTISLCADSKWEQVAPRAFEIGARLAVLDADAEMRLMMQTKQDSDAATRKPRGYGKAWVEVMKAYAPGMKPREAYKVYRRFGGTGTTNSFGKEFRERIKSWGARP